MIVDRIQAHLEAIYGLECGQRASAFVVGPADAKALGGTGRAEEELLVSEEEDALSVALYFSPQLLERLGRFEHLPAAKLMGRMLGSYCELAEGVSHFVYLLQVAAQTRRVSLLELETQAEVDKFAICVLARWADGERWARELLTRLFDRVSFRSGLSVAEAWRYAEANRVAKRYCSRLLRQVAERRLEPFLAELRRSYRLGAQAKLQYFARAA